ncbi:contractile injection system tape measure protein [Accumulibacter sp.]|jgi:hypothetical protein|uniref:contractile injection system tape measure protein n=1 Tax=Accumulibacter sp. TaxID=2053492 RepID=UPI001AC88658|nr:contractile injection system tape measure protein [Accumulibacter sp.]MBN8447460.1 hypothetical protein [Candidatus Accumulibacter necessarius]MBN8452061.1 hypothetical protein [Accumulibacter sp.]
MIAQQHKIMRQVLEVRGGSRDAAQHLQTELRDAYRQRLLPLIEAICSELSAPGRIDRVDRLEIDLGELPLETFEAALVDSFAPAFRSRLADAIDDAPESDADLELFDHFIRTGTVPWWADVADRDLLPAALERLLGRAPRTLRRTIVAAADGERTLGRIVRACSDDLLDQLAAVLAPRWTAACPGLGSAWIAFFGWRREGQGESARAERHLLWDEILRAAIAEDVSATEAPRVFSAVLRRFARRRQLDGRSLMAELHHVLADASVSVPPWTREVMEALWRATGGNLLETCEVTPASESASAHALERLPSASPGIPIAAASVVGGILQDALDAAGEQAPSAPKSTSRVDRAFSDADAIYVDNAGLVILWPFLQSFFGRLGLLGEKRLRDEAAAHRAAGLLQYVATGDEAPPEYLLPLNKVLCGLALDEVFDFGDMISTDEVEECSNLLTAVIAQAPILHQMSIAGLRGSFLLRQGQLSARDGNWLLRVQRETHDIVLDRFPWSVQIVKLPWMDTLMHVEW